MASPAASPRAKVVQSPLNIPMAMATPKVAIIRSVPRTASLLQSAFGGLVAAPRSVAPAPRVHVVEEEEEPSGPPRPPPAPKVAARPARQILPSGPELAPFAINPHLKYGGATKGDEKDNNVFKYVTFSEMPTFGPEHKSLMAKFLTSELFDQLKDVKTKSGYSLSNAIMTGVVLPHLHVGVTAGDEESYTLFRDLFYPIIQEWHGIDPNTNTQPTADLDPEKIVFTDKQRELFNIYVNSTRIRAIRNISGFSLPAGAKPQDRADVELVLKQTFEGFTGPLAGRYHSLGNLTEDLQDFLMTGGYLFNLPGPKNLMTGAGAARDWPHNRGLFINESHTAVAWINEEDHCRILSIEIGGDVDTAFTRFCQIATAVNEAAVTSGSKIMWNDSLGYLSTCPSNCGSGLRASVLVTLPEFSKLTFEGTPQTHKDLLDGICNRYGLQARGSSGEHSTAIGGRFDISNKQRFGLTEVELVQMMIDGVTKVIEYEKMLENGSTVDSIWTIISPDYVPPSEPVIEEDSENNVQAASLSTPAPEEAETETTSATSSSTSAQEAPAASSSVPRIIISGAPASGKGTQCEFIKAEYPVVHLSAGDMLREAIKAGTDIGLKAKEFVENGALVPDEVMVGVILDRLQEDDCKSRGWLLDGFPRTSGQAEALKAANITCDLFLQLDVSEELLLERVIGRRLDPETGKIYHMKYSPPESDEIRDRLTQRDDDTEEKFKTRIDTYLANTESIISHFTDKLVTVSVTSADQTPASIYETIKVTLLEKLPNPESSTPAAASVVESASEPASEPASESVAEATTEPAPEAVAEPASEPEAVVGK